MSEGTLLLVAGLSNAGKTSFARHFVETVNSSTHVPLDKYFLDTPPEIAFLDWVQQPEAIDWPLAITHIRQLAHEDCYSPAFDAWKTNKRLSAGGSQHHDRSLLMKAGGRILVIPGCLAFLFPDIGIKTIKVFVDTSLEAIARRLGRTETDRPVEAFIAQHLTANFPVIQAFKNEADIIISGEGAKDFWSDACQQILELTIDQALDPPSSTMTDLVT